LRRYAQGAAVSLGNEYRFDHIAIANIKQPLDSAIRRNVLRYDRQRLNASRCFELLAQGLGEITHILKLRRSLLVYPPKELSGSETFFSEPLTKNGQLLKVKVEQIGRHCIT
jgi:hypothetical protein